MLRLMIYDRTCGPLSTAWRAGVVLYKGLRRFDATFGASSWNEALAFIEQHESIREVQYWGHGRWGQVLVDRDVLDRKGHRVLDALKERFTKDGLFWLRTCEAFGAQAGHDFASFLGDKLGVRVAGHTHIIGAIQSGLHGLRPGNAPDWSREEGISEGTADKPVRAHGSGVTRPRTITCFEGSVPEAWFA